MFDISKVFYRFIALLLGLTENHNFPSPLSQKEEKDLFMKMKNGDKNARARLIEHNLRLVSHIIKKYYSSEMFSI